MIEVGEYVRTKNKGIKRIDRIDENKTINKYLYYIGTDDDNDPCFGIIKTTDIVKHSKNIIDLVEVRDYVNRYRVVAIMEDMETGEIHLEMTSDYTNEIIGDCTIYNDDIKSIVTHEQFESIEYKVEEDK